MFAKLPAGFPKLEAVVRRLGAVTVVKPPPVEAIGRRLRVAYARARGDGYRHVSSAQLRKLPYAYWVPGHPPLTEDHPELVRRYWAEALPTAVRDGARRARRWLMPLFFTYCESFHAKDERFAQFAASLEAILATAEGEVADRLRHAQRQVAFFTPSLVPAGLAAALVAYDGRLEEAFAVFLLWPGFTGTSLGDAAFAAALSLPSGRIAERAVIVRILDWSRRLPSPVSKSVHRFVFADALLRPWLRRSPPDDVKGMLVEFFVRLYGDPRIVSDKGHLWNGVSSDALSVILRWLAGDTLRGFVRILERTADEIWQYRQTFWMAYYDAGHILEAWLALGKDAAALAGILQTEAHGMGYGELQSGAAPDQSVLLLKIGHLVFTEWSHNGALRAYRDDDPDAPSLYESIYYGQDLRHVASMDFHHGRNEKPELVHANSQGGTWQRKARDFIRMHTGIHVEDREIL